MPNIETTPFLLQPPLTPTPPPKHTHTHEKVKDRLFDLERSVEMTEWGERKLERENKGLQGLIERNRTRHD